MPHEYRGETVVAYVVSEDGAPLEVEDLERHCRGALAAYKRPSAFEVVDDLPRTASGKVTRHKLRGKAALL